jgi:hypothetical protein
MEAPDRHAEAKMAQAHHKDVATLAIEVLSLTEWEIYGTRYWLA